MPDSNPPSLRPRSRLTLSLLPLFALAALARTAAAAAPPDTLAARAAPCMSCHGKQGKAASDGYYPRIAGKPAGYLYNQLRNFRDGRRRQYPLMVYMVQNLSDDYLRELADFFAQQQVPYPPPQTVAAAGAVLERGHMLATHGDPARHIPACVACHGSTLTGVAPAIPGLLGLPRDYINAQFGAWRDGLRHAMAPDCMAQITQKLSVADISAVSAWLATQPVPADAAASTARTAPLPLACGSVPR